MNLHILLINMKDLILYQKDEEFSIRKFMRKPYFVFENKKVSDLLLEMKQSTLNLAIVLDEYGELAGIITLEDIIEEIVGEVQDEYDGHEALNIQKINERLYKVKGYLGNVAYSFIDTLKEKNITYWQILPIGPTSYGDSPYQSFSTFAGNPYFIDFDLLKEQGYLASEDYSNISWGSDSCSVDYGLLYQNRNKVFEILYKNFLKRIPDDFYSFCSVNDYWLEDYSLFMAIKDAHDGVSFDKWENDIRTREPKAIENWKSKCEAKQNYYKMLQYFFFKQWNELKNYANKNNVLII